MIIQGLFQPPPPATVLYLAAADPIAFGAALRARADLRPWTYATDCARRSSQGCRRRGQGQQVVACKARGQSGELEARVGAGLPG